MNATLACFHKSHCDEHSPGFPQSSGWEQLPWQGSLDPSKYPLVTVCLKLLWRAKENALLLSSDWNLNVIPGWVVVRPGRRNGGENGCGQHLKTMDPAWEALTC